MQVLIVEDDPSVARFLQQATEEAGYTVTVAHDGPTALDAARSSLYDLILLDVMLPGGLDGLAVCRRLRAAKIATPILMLTARDTLEDKVAGLDSGADDYIVKPFELVELLARMRALQRRQTETTTQMSRTLTVADLTLDTATRQAARGGKLISLSGTEYALLEHLMRNAGQILGRAQILEQVWHYDFGGNDNVLDVYISYLRAKVDKGHPLVLIQTVRGVGYRMVGAAEEVVGTPALASAGAAV